MCIDVTIMYGCGHKTANLFCCEKKIKSHGCTYMEPHEKVNPRRCRTCIESENLRLRKERNEAVQRTKAAEECLLEVCKECAVASQRAQYAEASRQEALERVRVVEDAFRVARHLGHANRPIFTEMILTYACMHTVKRFWCRRDVALKDCLRQQLKHTIEDICNKCRQKESKSSAHDAAAEDLQAKSATIERRVGALE